MNETTGIQSSRKIKTISVTALCVALFTFLAGTANAACASNPMKGQFNLSNVFALANKVQAVEPPLQESVAELKNVEEDQASIVGLWAVTYFVGRTSSVWDQGFEQWHSDGTELNIDNAVPPSLGNVCVGVYKEVGLRTFKLRHVTWNFDANGNLTGTFLLLQTVTVSPNGNAFAGTYTSDSFDLSGKVIPSAHAEGIVSATRITVD
jgi:hypothetical protein